MEDFDTPPAPPTFPSEDFNPENVLEVPEGHILEPGLPEGLIPHQDFPRDTSDEVGGSKSSKSEEDEEVGKGKSSSNSDSEEIEFGESSSSEDEEVEFVRGTTYQYGQGQRFNRYSGQQYYSGGGYHNSAANYYRPSEYHNPSHTSHYQKGEGYAPYKPQPPQKDQEENLQEKKSSYKHKQFLEYKGKTYIYKNGRYVLYRPEAAKPKPYKPATGQDKQPYKPKNPGYQPTKYDHDLGIHGNSYIPGYRPEIVNPKDPVENYKPEVQNIEEEDDEDDHINSFVPKKPTTGDGSVSFIAEGSQWQKIKEKHGEEEKYSDHRFPPELKSIMGFNDHPRLKPAHFQHIVWKRPEEFFGEDFMVFKDEIKPNDIMQGQLGDCFYLGAIAAVAEYQDRIKKIILSREPEPSGAYCVALNVTGNWEEIVVDDNFCYDPRPGREGIAFDRTKDNELWVMLLEKAYAKVFGSFVAINGGLASEALNDLTGAPVTSFFPVQGTPAEHWKNIYNADYKKFIMTACTGDLKGSGDDTADKSLGICGNHAYSLLGAYEIAKVDGQFRALKPDSKSGSRPGATRIVKIRNPWGIGKGEWARSWGDSDPRWTPELLQDIGHETKDDGIFCMEFKDFLKYYANYQICYYHDNYYFSANKYIGDELKPTVIEFKISQPGYYYFQLNQNSRGLYPRKKNYNYSMLTMIIGQIAPNGAIKYLGMTSEKKKHFFIKANCAAGRYVAIVITPWTSIAREFGFCVYGPQETVLRLTGSSALPEGFIKAIIAQKCQLDRTGLIFYRDGVGSKCEVVKGAFCYVYFENNSAEITMTVRVDTENGNCVGCEVSPEPVDGKVEIVVAPGEKKVFLAKFVDKYSKFNVSGMGLMFS